jgi:hypothetical protein
VKSLALLLLSLLACGCGTGVDESSLGNYTTRGWSLVGAYERAHKENNVEHALALVNLGSVDVRTRDVLIKSLKEDFAKELVSAELLPLTGNEQLEFAFNGRRVVPNLKVEQRLHVEMRSSGPDGKPVSSTTDYFVGKLNGREMIASSHDAP